MITKILTPAKSFFLKCKRVWHVMKKPSQKEFSMISKVSAIGILVVGAFGFLISIVLKMIIG